VHRAAALTKPINPHCSVDVLEPAAFACVRRVP
jgi:hypothetical protein